MMNTDFIDRFTELNNILPKAPLAVRQLRGRQFEALINDVFEAEEILLRRGRHTTDNKSEEIDGAVGINENVFLLEMKWVAKSLAASSLYSFIGKVENKFHGTLGVFISRNELKENFINALNRGRRQNVIVIHGEDLDHIFKLGSPSLKEYINYCRKLLSFDNRTHFPFADFAKIFNSKQVGRPKQYNSKQSNIDATEFVLNILHQPTAKDLILPKFKLLSPEDRYTVFDLALAEYATGWYAALSNWQDRSYVNYENFFRRMKSHFEEVIAQRENYFGNFLPEDYMVYGHKIFRDLFFPHYGATSEIVRLSMEARLVAEFKAQFGRWENENRLTEIFDELWLKLSDDTREELTPLYLQIYVSTDRLDKFEQKTFARTLVNKLVDRDEILLWVSSQFNTIAKTYAGELTDKRRLELSTPYYPLLKAVNIEDLQDFVFRNFPKSGNDNNA